MEDPFGAFFSGHWTETLRAPYSRFLGRQRAFVHFGAQKAQPSAQHFCLRIHMVKSCAIHALLFPSGGGAARPARFADVLLAAALVRLTARIGRRLAARHRAGGFLLFCLRRGHMATAGHRSIRHRTAGHLPIRHLAVRHRAAGHLSALRLTVGHRAAGRRARRA